MAQNHLSGESRIEGLLRWQDFFKQRACLFLTGPLVLVSSCCESRFSAAKMTSGGTYWEVLLRLIAVIPEVVIGNPVTFFILKLKATALARLDLFTDKIGRLRHAGMTNERNMANG